MPRCYCAWVQGHLWSWGRSKEHQLGRTLKEGEEDLSDAPAMVHGLLGTKVSAPGLLISTSTVTAPDSRCVSGDLPSGCAVGLFYSKGLPRVLLHAAHKSSCLKHAGDLHPLLLLLEASHLPHLICDTLLGLLAGGVRNRVRNGVVCGGCCRGSVVLGLQ